MSLCHSLSCTKTLTHRRFPFIISVQEGASTQVFLAAAELSPSVAGKFFSDGKVMKVQSFATDEEKAEELWALSEKLSGVKFDL